MPRGHKRDMEATKVMGFADKRSFISLDGELFLYGKDWGPHREKLFARTQGQCENIKLSIWTDFCPNRITLETMEAHHVIPRGKGGSDDLSNLLAICFGCHRAEHVGRNPRWSKRVQELRNQWEPGDTPDVC
jgi:5-methylcytosine-specific restriction endonuclease McrA